MARVGTVVQVLAGFIDDNKSRAIIDEVIPKTSSKLLSADLISFTSKLPKDFPGEISLCEIASQC
jgi:hypothetical protein